MRILLALFLALTASAQEWNFNTPSDTSSVVVTPGAFSEGWIDTMYGLGTNQGFWDLGQQGSIVATTSVPSNSYAIVEVAVTAWYDGGIYAAPEVYITKGELLESTRTYNSGRLGAWQTFTTAWLVVLNPGDTKVTVGQSNPQKSTVVDSIKAQFSIPRGALPEVPKKVKSPKKK